MNMPVYAEIRKYGNAEMLHKGAKYSIRNPGVGAADIFLEMVTQPFPGFDGIVQDSSNQATV